MILSVPIAVCMRIVATQKAADSNIAAIVARFSEDNSRESLLTLRSSLRRSLPLELHEKLAISNSETWRETMSF